METQSSRPKSPAKDLKTELGPFQNHNIDLFQNITTLNKENYALQ